MKVSEGFKKLRATKVYLVDVLATHFRVTMKKTGRVVMDVNVIAGEVDDDTIAYLIAEAELLNEAKPDFKKR